MNIEELEKRITNIEDNVKELMRKIIALEDLEKIKQLQYRYLNGINNIAWGEVLDCFTEDAVVEIGRFGRLEGKAQFRSLFEKELPKRHVGKEGNFEVHPIIMLNGDKAQGTWLMYVLHADPESWEPRPWSQGIYDMEYTKVEGEWKISHLKWRCRLGGPPPYKHF